MRERAECEMRDATRADRRARVAFCISHLILFPLLACSDGTASDHAPLTRWTVAPALRVDGNRLVDVASGRPVLLRGVNRPGTESACARGTGGADGPLDSAAVEAMRGWGITAVRVPLNESCWLGLSGIPAAYTGETYRAAIADWVALLRRRGMVVIVALDWSGTGTTVDVARRPMPARATAPAFWTQVASRFAGDRAVLFDVYGAPWPNGNRLDAEAWRCWRDGGTCGHVDYEAAGMQELVTAIRNTGATNVVLVAGVQFGSNFNEWLASRPFDPRGNLGAAWRIFDSFTCARTTCWDSWAAPVARTVPLVLTEFGAASGSTALPLALVDWTEANGASWLAAGWRASGAADDLVADWAGTPTSYGEPLRARLAR